MNKYIQQLIEFPDPQSENYYGSKGQLDVILNVSSDENSQLKVTLCY